jgi:ribulose-5-phosphate 4-epimerase/fuculose-1-phosphate aldolase
MKKTSQEGVIKFTLDYTRNLAAPAVDVSELSAARRKLWQLGLIGQSAEKYAGVGYGNVSCRLPSGENRFLVSGTQTGAIEWLGPEHYARVTGFDIAANRITAEGPLPPSSESLTHAMLYALDPAIQSVLHVHAPGIWCRAHTLGLPVTHPDVAYGTPAMAREVERLFRETDARTRGLFVMGGHEDGVVAYGDSVRKAEKILLDCHALSNEQQTD